MSESDFAVITGISYGLGGRHDNYVCAHVYLHILPGSGCNLEFNEKQICDLLKANEVRQVKQLVGKIVRIKSHGVGSAVEYLEPYPLAIDNEEFDE